MIEKLDEDSSFGDALATKQMGGGRWKIQLFYIALVATAFWFIDHDVESSEYFKYRMDYEGSINKTADRVEKHQSVLDRGSGCIGNVLHCIDVYPASEKCLAMERLAVVFDGSILLLLWRECAMVH